ncbi:hypothetical protein KKA15_00880 [Patescibacteria group bacterium]|nr:hypothetical protein [Patescibacteria group bacterium]
MKESDILKIIYPSVVTWLGDWEKSIADVKRLKLKEISLFLTGAKINERKRIYQALENTLVNSIPHVHIRQEESEDELDYFVKNYKTKAFTLHYQYIDFFKNSKHKKKIYIENNWKKHKIEKLSKLNQVGGVCIDLSHHEQFRLTEKECYVMSQKSAENFKIGCNHLSAVRKDGESWHEAKNLDELKYVINIPKKYFSKYICLELVNPISQQIKFKKEIAKLLSKAWQKKS